MLVTVGQLLLSGVMIGGVYALMAMGLTLIFGVLKVVNFAHGEFLMMAMYGAWALNSVLGLNPYAAIVVVVPVLFAFGLLVHQVVIRPAIDKSHLVAVFATMGLSILLQNVALFLLTADLRDIPPPFRNESLALGPLLLRKELALGFALSVAVTLAMLALIRWTYFGKAVRATAQDREAAMLMGINVPRVFALTFAAGSALVGLAGCALMPLYSTFPSVGLNFVLIAFVVVVLGGMGSMEGAFAGGICIGLVQAFSGYYVAPSLGQMFYFLVFILILIVRPAGLLGQRGAATVAGG